MFQVYYNLYICGSHRKLEHEKSNKHQKVKTTTVSLGSFAELLPIYLFVVDQAVFRLIRL